MSMELGQKSVIAGPAPSPDDRPELADIGLDYVTDAMPGIMRLTK
jgi:hypothetical protein